MISKSLVMEKKSTKLLLVFLSVFSFNLSAQNISSDVGSEGNGLIKENDAEHPCITAQEYEIIERRCAENIKQFGINRSANRTMTVSLGWPLRASASLHDCSYYHIAAYVDQNTTAGVFQDFSCGTNSYDGHNGTDIATWPFNFYKMDNNLVEVVAAGPGTIIDKHDGEFDRNCSSNNLTANYVIIQHADGSVALYWHMKKNSITSVAIGQPVAAGDYLGVVGSSGSASGPHLHFEVWSGTTVATRKDPYAGACNILNANSWWTSQKPAKETAIIKVSTNTTDIVFPGCPTTETPNEASSFQIPFQGSGLSPGYAKFYIFIRDEVNGLTANLSILNPNNTTYMSWTYNSNSDNKIRYWGWSKLLPTLPGIYTFQATYNSITCSTTFDIINPATSISIPGTANQRTIYPNPSNGTFTIEGENNNESELVIYDLPGKNIFQSEIVGNKSEINLHVKSGVYFYELKDKTQFISRGKIVVQ